MNYEVKINRLLKLFARKFHAYPIMGAEIEFYLLKQDAQFIEKLKLIFLENKTAVLDIEPERGRSQYEIKTYPFNNLIALAKNLRQIREAVEANFIVSFAGRPFLDDYPNALQFHINLVNANNENLFEDNELMEKSIAGLCATALKYLKVFLPTKACYNRLEPPIMMAPTTISWGGNNRTTAIRIPNVLPRRLEHRISSAIADPVKVIYAILSGVYYGLKHNPTLPPKIWGNADEAQYNLKRLS